MPILPLLAATLVLNEVLYDPPGADAGREFVEIYNASDVEVPIAGLVLETGDGARPGIWRRAWEGTHGALAPGAILLVGADSVAALERLLVDLQNGPDAVLDLRTYLVALVGSDPPALVRHVGRHDERRVEDRPDQHPVGAALAGERRARPGRPAS